MAAKQGAKGPKGPKIDGLGRTSPPSGGPLRPKSPLFEVPISLLILLYVAARIGLDIAGTMGAAGVVCAFLILEAVLFRNTRSQV